MADSLLRLPIQSSPTAPVSLLHLTTSVHILADFRVFHITSFTYMWDLQLGTHICYVTSGAQSHNQSLSPDPVGPQPDPLDFLDFYSNLLLHPSALLIPFVSSSYPTPDFTCLRTSAPPHPTPLHHPIYPYLPYLSLPACIHFLVLD